MYPNDRYECLFFIYKDWQRRISLIPKEGFVLALTETTCSRLQHYQQQQVDEWSEARQYDTLKRSRFPLISAVHIFVFTVQIVHHLSVILMVCWVPCSALSLSLCIRGSTLCLCSSNRAVEVKWPRQMPFCLQWKNKIYWKASASEQCFVITSHYSSNIMCDISVLMKAIIKCSCKSGWISILTCIWLVFIEFI